MKNIIFFLFLYVKVFSYNGNVVDNYERWQNSSTNSKIKSYDRSRALQNAENKLLDEKLDSLYAIKKYEDTVKDRELYREYLRSRIWRKNNYRYDYYEDHWAWSAKKWW